MLKMCVQIFLHVFHIVCILETHLVVFAHHHIVKGHLFVCTIHHSLLIVGKDGLSVIDIVEG